MIRYVAHSEINKARWDSCIDQSHDGIIFAYSWYLDAICEQWDALVADDYVAVMPLPSRKKWGIDYIYTPFFLNQLGVFFKQAVSASMVDEFLSNIPDKFRYIDLNLNQSNLTTRNDFKIKQKTIQQIDLDKSYEQIQQDYSENLKRNLKKAVKNELHYVENISAEIVVNAFRKAQGEKLEVFKKSDYMRLLELIQILVQKGMGETIGVYSKNNLLLAAACFMKSHEQIIYLKGAANEEGKTMGAMHFLMDYYIRKHAGSDLIFDFGGSSVESLARFNNSFGSKEIVYLQIKKNNLPALVRWIKD